MKEGHSFGKEHGFTGSAHPSKEYGATCPGFKRGHMVKPPIMPHTMQQPMDGSNDDEMSAPSMPSAPGFKHGGMHRKEHHEKHDQVKYDKHGFQHHKNHE